MTNQKSKVSKAVIVTLLTGLFFFNNPTNTNNADTLTNLSNRTNAYYLVATNEWRFPQPTSAIWKDEGYEVIATLSTNAMTNWTAVYVDGKQLGIVVSNRVLRVVANSRTNDVVVNSVSETIVKKEIN